MPSALAEQLAYLMATLDTKNSSSGNQRDKEEDHNRGNGPENQGPTNNNKKGVH